MVYGSDQDQDGVQSEEGYPMVVQTAVPEDIPAWRLLAAEVEPLFGPMVGRPGFEAALQSNVVRGSAFCVRADDGPAGRQLLGGLLWSARRAVINWLAVAATARRQGVASLLLTHVFDLVERPAAVSVTTFALEVAGGAPARAFYQQHGFQPAEMVPDDPSRQVLRLWLPTIP